MGDGLWLTNVDHLGAEFAVCQTSEDSDSGRGREHGASRAEHPIGAIPHNVPQVHVPSQESAGSARKVGVKKAEARLAGGSRSSDIHTDAKEGNGHIVPIASIASIAL